MTYFLFISVEDALVRLSASKMIYVWAISVGDYLFFGFSESKMTYFRVTSVEDDLASGYQSVEDDLFLGCQRRKRIIVRLSESKMNCFWVISVEDGQAMIEKRLDLAPISREIKTCICRRGLGLAICWRGLVALPRLH